MPRYIEIPFAASGDRVEVPFLTDPNGFVSYTTGYGYDYERDPDPLVDPLTKDIERDKMNSILYDVTDIAKQYQDSGGAPNWFAERETTGGYPRDARVTHGGVIYTSTVNGNVSTPGASPTWILGGQTDPTIIAIAGLEPGANQFIYFTAPDVAALWTITSFGRNLVGAAGDAQGRIVLGITEATTTKAGLMEFSTDAELNSGVNERAVTPRQLRLNFSSNTAGINNPSWMGGQQRRWGSIVVPGNSSAPTGNIFTTQCFMGVVSLGMASLGDFQAPKCVPSGRGLQIYNSDSNAVTVNYIAEGI